LAAIVEPSHVCGISTRTNAAQEDGEREAGVGALRATHRTAPSRQIPSPMLMTARRGSTPGVTTHAESR
jgi:hypothetical protein